MGRKARDKRDKQDRQRPFETADAPQPSPAVEAGAVAHRAQARMVLPRKAGAWALGLAVAAVLCYLNSLDTPFLLDDPINIAKNPVIQRPLSPARLLLDPRAAITISLRLNYVSGALAVAGYHALNIAAHVVAGWLLFALAFVTLRLPVFENRPARVAEPLAATIAAVFLLHPMQTESATYIIQRAEIFVSAAMMAALLAFVAFDAAATRSRRAGSLAFLAAACVAGTYSKPSFAVLPALLLLYDLCFLSRGRLDAIGRKWQAYAIAAAAAAWTFVLSHHSGSFADKTAGFEIEGLGPWTYLSAQPGVILTYLRVALWPDALCFDCGYKGAWPVVGSWFAGGIAVPAGILAALSVAALASWKSYPLATFAVFGSAVALAPTSSFVPLSDVYVEHRMYLPIGLIALALVPAAFDATGVLAARAGLSAAMVRGMRRALAVAVLAVLALLTVQRNRVFADPLALLLDTVGKAPQNERAQYNLANEYKRRGEQDKAIERYNEAIRIAPHVVRSYMNLGGIYLAQQRYEEALQVFLAGTRNVPGVAMAHRNVAVAYARLGRYGESLEAAERSLALEPDNANGHSLKAQALDQLDRRAEAIAAYEKVLQLAPGQADVKKRLEQLKGG